MTLGERMMEMLSFFDSPLQRVPQAHHAGARDHLAMDVIGAAAISWGVVSTSRAMMTTILGSRYHLHRRNIVLHGPFVIVSAITFQKARHGPRRPDRIAPACSQVKVLA
jgi:hypothetical protein